MTMEGTVFGLTEQRIAELQRLVAQTRADRPAGPVDLDAADDSHAVPLAVFGRVDDFHRLSGLSNFSGQPLCGELRVLNSRTGRMDQDRGHVGVLPETDQDPRDALHRADVATRSHRTTHGLAESHQQRIDLEPVTPR